MKQKRNGFHGESLRGERCSLYRISEQHGGAMRQLKFSRSAQAYLLAARDGAVAIAVEDGAVGFLAVGWG
jgi:hypothetical protein